MDDRFRVTGWTEGGSESYLTLSIECGPLKGHAEMGSMDARDLAIDIIAHQGPYLLFQPPNPSMRERSGDAQRAGNKVKTVNRRRVASNIAALQEFTDEELHLELKRRANDG